MSRYVTLLFPALLALDGCQSGPGASLSSASIPARHAGVRASSDAEMAEAMAAAERAQAVAPAVGAAGIVGGLDPTGVTQTAVNAEAERRLVELQKHLPGVVARNRSDTERLCSGKPTQPELADACRQFAQAKAGLASVR